MPKAPVAINVCLSVLGEFEQAKFGKYSKRAGEGRYEVICEARALNVWLEMGHGGKFGNAGLQGHYTAWVGDCWYSWELYIRFKGCLVHMAIHYAVCCMRDQLS
jgi:hypothetical protein